MINRSYKTFSFLLNGGYVLHTFKLINFILSTFVHS